MVCNGDVAAHVRTISIYDRYTQEGMWMKNVKHIYHMQHSKLHSAYQTTCRQQIIRIIEQ